MTELTTRQAEFAHALVVAAESNQPLTESDWAGVVTTDDAAYVVQDEVMRQKGLPVAGYKVSLTSKQTQQMFDSDSPLYGQQVAKNLLAAPATVQLADLNEPLVEVELAFRAKEDLSPDDSLEDLLHKTTVAGALELPDARFADWFPSLGKYNVMADCAVGGRVVYGNEQASDQVFTAVDELATVSAQLFLGDRQLDSGTSSEVLGNPLNSLQWLVRKLADQDKQFRQGQLVSSGTFVLPPKLVQGHWRVHFDHGLGDVELTVQ